MRAVIAFGPEGGRLLESLMYAAMVEQVEPMRFLWIEPDDKLADLQELLHAVKRLHDARATKAFFTLDTWHLTDGVASRMDEDTALLQTFFDRYEAAASWRSRGDRHPNLSALAYGAQAAAMPSYDIWMNCENPTVLCGAAYDSRSAAGLMYFARKLKECGAHTKGVVLLPYQHVKPEQQAVAAETLRMLAQEEVLDATYLLGMPEGCKTDKNGAHLIHWLGAQAVIDAARPDAQGVMTMLATAGSFGWADFGTQAKQLQGGYTGLLYTSAMMLTEVLPTLRERLGNRPKLGQKRSGWFNVYFRQAHKLEEKTLAELHQQVAATEVFCRHFIRWVLEIVAGLPQHWQDREAFTQAEMQMAEHYRLLLEAAGELALMDEEIQRSGMAKEQLVRRGVPKETAADELLRKADEKRSIVKHLETEQAALDKQAGGAAKKRLMARMVLGIDRALEAEAARVAAWKDTSAGQGAAALQLQESIYRLETHMRMLRAERGRVEADQAALTEILPPHLPSVRPWGNDLFSPETLDMLAQFMTTQDEKERSTQAAALLERCGGALYQLRGREETLLTGLWRQLLEMTAEEVR